MDFPVFAQVEFFNTYRPDHSFYEENSLAALRTSAEVLDYLNHMLMYELESGCVWLRRPNQNVYKIIDIPTVLHNDFDPIFCKANEVAPNSEPDILCPLLLVDIIAQMNLCTGTTR